MSAKENAQESAASGLPRVLGLRDIVLLYAVAIIGPQWLSTAAQSGAASLALWVLALVAFFVPCGFAVMEMNSRYAGEGGLYVWVKQAFGDFHGFVCGWSYVVSNFVFFVLQKRAQRFIQWSLRIFFFMIFMSNIVSLCSKKQINLRDNIQLP